LPKKKTQVRKTAYDPFVQKNCMKNIDIMHTWKAITAFIVWNIILHAIQNLFGLKWVTHSKIVICEGKIPWGAAQAHILLLS